MRTADGRRWRERAFRQQWLNQWVPSSSDPKLLDEAAVLPAVTQDALFGPGRLRVEVTPDRSVATILACAGGVLDVVAERTGVAWVVPFLAERVEMHGVVAVAFDSLGPAAGLGLELRATPGEKVLLLSGRDVAAASGLLFEAG